jgi:hypothetical protein
MNRFDDAEIKKLEQEIEEKSTCIDEPIVFETKPTKKTRVLNIEKSDPTKQLGIMIFLLGCLFLLSDVEIEHRIATWSIAQGTVVSLSFRPCTKGGDRGSPLIHLLSPKFSYSYSVNGIPYIGDKTVLYTKQHCMAERYYFDTDIYHLLSPNWNTYGLSTDEAQILKKQYSVNTKVFVYYNAKQPSDAFLILELGQLFGWFELVTIIFGLFLILLSMNKDRKRII